MPPSKRQRSSGGATCSTHEDSDSSNSDLLRPHKNAHRVSDEDKENNIPDAPTKSKPVAAPVVFVSRTPHRGGLPVGRSKDPKPYEYICFHRPLFDVDGEHWRNWSEGKAEYLNKHEIYTQLYKPGYVEESKNDIFGALPTKHKDHKWVIMWSAWLRYDGFCRRAKYCDPDNINMQLHTDWKGWSMQEIVDNAMLDFDRAFREKGAQSMDKMWAIMSAIGLWVNVEDISELVHNGDGDKTCELIGLIGCALLTVLSAIDRAGELNPHSRFLDLALVIGYYLELSHDLPAFSIEGACVCWRKEVVLLFKKGKLDAKKGLFDTARRLDELKHTPNVEPLDSDDETEDEADADLLHHQHGTEKDPWAWGATFGAYKKKHSNTIGLQQYELTKSTRAEQAETSCNGKDLLAGVR